MNLSTIHSMDPKNFPKKLIHSNINQPSLYHGFNPLDIG